MTWEIALNRTSKSALKAIKPPPKLTVSEWANQYLQLSAEDSAEPGQFSTDRAPYQKGIMDAVSERGIHTVVVKSSAQIGKTAILKAIIGFHVDQDPAPILMLQPTEHMAEAFSKDRLAPMIRDTPALKDKIADPRSRDSGNSILHKRFAGGHLTLAGSNSPAGLASRPIRIVLCDEVDRYPASAGSEGDPVNLAIKRTATFWNRRIVLTSTPTIKGASRIDMAYENSDQRHFYVPCPHCGTFHIFKWENCRWPPGEPDRAIMVCPECAVEIEESHKPRICWQWENGELKCLLTASPGSISTNSIAHGENGLTLRESFYLQSKTRNCSRLGSIPAWENRGRKTLKRPTLTH
ncbi:MAG: phage terminase large subunit family protein [Vampirovibrionales bacterium]|nr:phage terminase large subunit family protein [Vampirovibrionales bacterium]